MTSLLVPSPLPNQLRQDLLEAFLSGRNEKTVEAYKQDLESFQQFLATSTRKDAVEFLISLPHGQANGVVLAYRSHLTSQGLQPATVNRRLAALRSFVKLAQTLGVISWHLDIENVKSRSYRDTKGPGKQGVQALLNSIDSPTHKNIRDRTIIHLLYDLGLRRSEVVGMDRVDVQLEAGTIAVLGKGRTQKETLTLPEPTKEALAE
jgi:integrase/recombinase XerC